VGASYSQARAYERAAIRERATLVFAGRSFPGAITRIGGGGVFFEGAAPLEKGEIILIRFRLACFEEPVVVKGEVRWVADPGGVHPPGLGIAFLDLDPKKRAQIVEFVADRGNVLCEVGEMLKGGETDLARYKRLLEKVDLGNIGSIDELKARVRGLSQ